MYSDCSQFMQVKLQRGRGVAERTKSRVPQSQAHCLGYETDTELGANLNHPVAGLLVGMEGKSIMCFQLSEQREASDDTHPTTDPKRHALKP